jgi:hypothetical protein
VGAGEIDRGRRRREIGARLAPIFVRACSSLHCCYFFGFAPAPWRWTRSSVQDFFSVLAILLIIFYK